MRKKITLITLLYLILNMSYPCTIGVASNSINESNRPILWKSRDISPTTINTVRHVDILNYDFLGVTSPGQNRMWMGINEEGLALANSLSNDLTVSEGTFNNGNLIFNALGTCSDLEDLEDYLDFLNASSLDLELRGNFVAFDASGSSKLYEVNNNNYWTFPTNSLNNPFQIRTNHSINGGGMEGIERLVRSRNILENLVTTNQLNVTNLLSQHTRDVSDAHSQALDLPWEYGDPTPLLDTSYSINRSNTISAVVIEGVGPDEDPKLTTMWLIMGNPFVSYAIPLLVDLDLNLSILNSISENSPELVARLWSSDNDYLLDTSKFLSEDFSLLQEITSRESQIYSTFEELKYEWLEDDINDSIIASYINEQASQALNFSTQVLHNFTSIHDSEIALDSNLKVFPNPFYNNLEISLKTDKHEDGKLKIYNIRGQLVTEYKITSNEKSLIWDGKNSKKEKMPAGLYIISYQSSQKHEVTKAILMK